MALYDGRVSKTAVKHYDEYYIKKNKPPSDDDDEKTRAARLIVEGHRMIKRRNKIAPYPLAVVSKIFTPDWLPYFWQDTIIGFIFIVLPAFVSSYYIKNYEFYNKSVELFLIAALIISGLTCLRIMARATINALVEVVSMLEIPRNKDTDKIPASVPQIEKT